MKKGAFATISIAIIVVVIITALVYLSITRITNPTLETYGGQQAHVLAQRLGSSINALSSMEQGILMQRLGGIWEIQVYKRDGKSYLSVSYTDPDSGRFFTSTRDGKDLAVLGEVEESGPFTSESVIMEKVPGRPVRVSKG